MQDTLMLKYANVSLLDVALFSVGFYSFHITYFPLYWKETTERYMEFHCWCFLKERCYFKLLLFLRDSSVCVYLMFVSKKSSLKISQEVE